LLFDYQYLQQPFFSPGGKAGADELEGDIAFGGIT